MLIMRFSMPLTWWTLLEQIRSTSYYLFQHLRRQCSRISQLIMLSQFSIVPEVISILLLIDTILHGLLHSIDQTVIHSLCPALGERHSLVFKGLCPFHLQNPLGKKIDVSFIYFPPFSLPSPIGGIGSDFLIMQLLARKIGFIPRFIFGANRSVVISNVSWTLY